MTENNNLDYIAVNSQIDTLDEKLRTMKRKVTHGKLKIQRKKVKAQIMKKHKPTDRERESICSKAREKAHSVVANARRKISNDNRRSLPEGLEVVNPNSLCLTERYGLDFLEESVGYDIDITFFDKPEITQITEGLSVGQTKTGRNRKCKAIGYAEGCFAPISTPDGDRVFSRNHRLYEDDHWECQFENQNLLDRVKTRRMLGTIGHYDKKVDDKDLAAGNVSHIVTDLEIREDEEHGRYLWGRLEIINTEAGRRLKEYYDNGIPLYVSSRGGGKLINVPGKDYKIVDKNKYYCETFDVVKEPGFLEACPEYHNEELASEDTRLMREIADKTGLVVDKAQLAAIKDTLLYESTEEEDDDMPKVNVDVTATDSMEEVVRKVIQPMQDETQQIVKSLAESMEKLTQIVDKVRQDIYEEAPADESTEEVVSPESAVEESAEVTAEPQSEETVSVDEKCDKEDCKDKDGKCDKDDCKDKKDDKKAEEIKECSEGKTCDEKCDGEKKEDKADAKKEEKADKKEEKAEEIKEEVAEETVAEEPAAETSSEEPVDEQWAHIDPKETVTEKGEHKASQGKEQKPLSGDVWANEPAPEKANIANGENAPQEQDPTNKEEKPAVNGAVMEAEEPASEAAPAEAPVESEEQQVVDYQQAYEELKRETDKATQLIEEVTRLFDDLGKKHLEVVAESKKISEEYEKSRIAMEAKLNSYKLGEKFGVAIEDAEKMLSSKSYDEVVEELTEREAKKSEEEVEAKAQEVSEAVSEPAPAKVHVSRKVYSAFAISESSPEEPEGRQVFSWFKG